jgi:hypothetical protein
MTSSDKPREERQAVATGDSIYSLSIREALVRYATSAAAYPYSTGVL